MQVPSHPTRKANSMQKINVVLVDDLDGRVIEAGRGRTIGFALDGQSYELDLADDNVQRLRDALRPFISAARKTAGGAGRGRPRSGSASGRTRSSAGGELQAIRAWATANGHKVGDRGRIAAPVREAYQRAQRG